MGYKNTLFEEMEFSDVVFNIVSADKDPVEIRAHKLFLASVSQVFKAMFYGDLKEGDAVEIKDSTPIAFKNMIRFIYLREFEDTSTMALTDTMFLADKYMIEDLIDEIKKRITATEINVENVSDFVQFAEMYEGKEMYGCEELRDKCAMFLECTQFEDIKFNRTLWKHILEYNINFGMTPEKLFTSLTTWAQNQEPNQKIDRELLLHFPLTSMKCESLVKQVLALDLLTDKEFVEIHKAKEELPGGPWAQFLKPKNHFGTTETTLESDVIGNFTEMRIEPKSDMVLKDFLYRWSKSNYNELCNGEEHCNALVKFGDGLERQLKVEKISSGYYRSCEPIYLRANQTYVLSVNNLVHTDVRNGNDQSGVLIDLVISELCNNIEISMHNVCSECRCYIDEICFVSLKSE